MRDRLHGLGKAAASLALGAMLVSSAAGPARAELASMVRMASLTSASPLTDVAESPGEQILARVDLSQQTMEIFSGDQLLFTFDVSTGRPGYGTPVGSYHAQRLASKWRSRKYHNAPMPWSVFFHGGYAVHGTTEISRLGRPASHGCVRLHPDNAKIFFGLVNEAGMDNTTITIVQ